MCQRDRVDVVKVAVLDLSIWSNASGHSQACAATKYSQAVRWLDDEQRRSIRKSSAIPFSRKVGFDAILGCHAANLVLGDVDPSQTAIILTANQGHLPTVRSFIERAVDMGIGLVDPMQFPATLPSYAPTAIAAATGCTGPALAVGHGDDAAATALDIARDLLLERIVANAMIIATSRDSVARVIDISFAAAALLDLGDLDARDRHGDESRFCDLVGRLRALSSGMANGVCDSALPSFGPRLGT